MRIGIGGRLHAPSPFDNAKGQSLDPAQGTFVDAAQGKPLSGQLVVFTGKLSSLGRRDARALVARLGGETADDVTARTTILVVGSEGFGGPAERSRSQKLARAEELAAQGDARIEILSEDRFCRLVGVPTPDALKQQYHAVRDLLARYRHVREDHLRYLEKCGILRPVLRTNADTFFAFSDLGPIKQANDELGEGRSFRAIVRTLLAARQGQLAFDFRLDAAPAKIVSLQDRAGARRRRDPGTAGRPHDAALTSDELRSLPGGEKAAALAEEYFRIGSALDDGDEANLDRAAAAYRKALELDPTLVAALINLANAHYSRDELVEAQVLYERAIGLEPDFFEAHFNLGNIYHDLGRFDEALACYHEALRLNPFYADTHFYLAVTFEKMGLSQEARPHWRTYQQLAPQGEWVELAKEFSE
jgi:tetratricopeptide (TPR) repeat protein